MLADPGAHDGCGIQLFLSVRDLVSRHMHAFLMVRQAMALSGSMLLEPGTPWGGNRNVTHLRFHQSHAWLYSKLCMPGTTYATLAV